MTCGAVLRPDAPEPYVCELPAGHEGRHQQTGWNCVTEWRDHHR